MPTMRIAPKRVSTPNSSRAAASSSVTAAAQAKMIGQRSAPTQAGMVGGMGSELAFRPGSAALESSRAMPKTRWTG